MNNIKGVITDIHRTSLVDGPGIRTSIFMKGCPLRCIWCHNPETQLMTIEENYGREVDIDTVFSECIKDRFFYDESNGGVTISGGEPFMQPKFTIQLLKCLKEYGIHTTLDTSGYASQSTFQESLAVTDLYLFDYKASNPSKHLDFVKASQQQIIENLNFIILNGAKVILRCPIIPNVNDDHEHLNAISEMEYNYASLVQIEILPWHTMGNIKYSKLGISIDPRLPKNNTSPKLLENYRTFFLKSGNKKIKIPTPEETLSHP